MLDGREKEPYTKKYNKHSQDNGVLQRRSGTLLEQECELEQKELDFSKSSSFCLSLLKLHRSCEMQEKKGGIPGRKRFGKGKDCYGQKDHSRQWQKQKEGENI